MGQKSLRGNSLKRVELAVSCSRGFLCSKDTPLPTAQNEFITLVCTMFLPFFFRKNKLLDTNSWGRYSALQLFIFFVENLFLCVN